MIIRTVQPPVYRRRKKGLPGVGLKLGIVEAKGLGRTFDDYLLDLFQGEIVQEGGRFSSSLSDMMIRNLQKI